MANLGKGQFLGEPCEDEATFRERELKLKGEKRHKIEKKHPAEIKKIPSSKGRKKHRGEKCRGGEEKRKRKTYPLMSMKGKGSEAMERRKDKFALEGKRKNIREEDNQKKTLVSEWWENSGGIPPRKMTLFGWHRGKKARAQR